MSDVNHNEHHEKDKNGQEPIHCHFFNDVVVSKITSSSQTVVKSTNLIILYFAQFGSYYNEEIDINYFTDKISHFPDPIFLSENSPTRGSPLS